MSSFGWAGAAAGGQDALQEMLATKRAKYIGDQDLLLRQAQSARADQELQLQRQEAQAAQAERARQAKIQAAQIAVSQARPGDELSPDVAGQIQGTPYAARLETKQTLPSSTIPGFGGATQRDAGGRSFVNLKPTAEQEEAQGKEAARRRVVDLFKRGASKNEILSGLADAGENIPATELLKDPNRELQDRLTEIGAQGEQARRTALTTAGAERATTPIGPRDRVAARRQADAAATDYLESLARESGGFLPAGVDPDAVRAQFVNAYMADMDPVGAKTANTQRVVTNLRKIMPGPYGSRQTPTVRPVLGVTPRSGPASGDPFEAYLARQRQ